VRRWARACSMDVSSLRRRISMLGRMDVGRRPEPPSPAGAPQRPPAAAAPPSAPRPCAPADAPPSRQRSIIAGTRSPCPAAPACACDRAVSTALQAGHFALPRPAAPGRRRRAHVPMQHTPQKTTLLETTHHPGLTNTMCAATQARQQVRRLAKGSHPAGCCRLDTSSGVGPPARAGRPPRRGTPRPGPTRRPCRAATRAAARAPGCAAAPGAPPGCTAAPARAGARQPAAGRPRRLRGAADRGTARSSARKLQAIIRACPFPVPIASV